jgi:hypothetical protein
MRCPVGVAGGVEISADTVDRIVNQKVVPAPTVDSTPIEPPIRVARCLVMARPRPVPPNSRVTLVSPCSNGVKSRACWVGEIPRPVSLTLKQTATSVLVRSMSWA